MRLAVLASLIGYRAKAPKLAFERMISLGGRCETAYQLRRYSRRERAYPFDWWITPIHTIPKLLREGTAGAFAPAHLEKLASYEGKPALYSHFSGALAWPGTIHLHEFPYEADWQPLSLDEISARLTGKYEALDRRLAEDARAGPVLFVRQRLAGQDPDTPEQLGPLVEAIMAELERLSDDFALLLLDSCPLPPRPRLIQATVPPMPGIKGLGSARAWRRMFRQIGISAGRGAKPDMRDIFETLPPAGR